MEGYSENALKTCKEVVDKENWNKETKQKALKTCIAAIDKKAWKQAKKIHKMLEDPLPSEGPKESVIELYKDIKLENKLPMGTQGTMGGKRGRKSRKKRRRKKRKTRRKSNHKKRRRKKRTKRIR